MAEGVALLGGSFNPIHIGHLIIARAVGELLDVQRVILVPSAQPPHKRGDDLAEAADRLEMTRLAVAGEPRLEVSDIEVRRQGPSYTILTVEEYRRSLGSNTGVSWIIGSDTLPELHTWYRIRELVDMCRLVTAMRPGCESPDLSALVPLLSPAQLQKLRDGIMPTPRIDVAATDIRRRVREGRSIRYLVPDPVREFVEERGLYRTP